jgi:uncharacterized protein YggT (Ycf19 family)
MIRELLCQLVSLYVLLIIIRVISSWFPANPNGPFGQIIRSVRRAVPFAGPLDLSPIIVVLFLNIVVQQFILGC